MKDGRKTHSKTKVSSDIIKKQSLNCLVLQPTQTTEKTQLHEDIEERQEKQGQPIEQAKNG